MSDKPHYKKLAEYMRKKKPGLSRVDDKRAAKYAIKNHPEQFKEDDFDWEDQQEVVPAAETEPATVQKDNSGIWWDIP